MNNTDRWVENFLVALDDGNESRFIDENAKQINVSAYRLILLKYIDAVHELGAEAKEQVQDYVREELEAESFHL